MAEAAATPIAPDSPSKPSTGAAPSALSTPIAQPADPSAGELATGITTTAQPPAVQGQTWELVSRDKRAKEAKPVAKFTFTSKGGAIQRVEMIGQVVDSLHYPDAIVQVNDASSHGVGVLAFGVSDSRDPQFEEAEYSRIDDGSNPNQIVLQTSTSDNIVIKKTYQLDAIKDEEGNPLEGTPYTVKLRVEMHNGNEAPVKIENVGLFAGAAHPISSNELADAYTHFFYLNDDNFSQETPSYFTGGMFSSAKARELALTAKLGYAGVMNQYYATIVIPATNATPSFVFAKNKQYHLKEEKNKEVAGVHLTVGMPNLQIAPNATHALDYDIFIGPKRNQMLSAMPGKLDEVMGYGWLTLISYPMNWLLNLFQGWFGNWGIAIICMTIVVRIVIWPLHKKSYMSMKRMSLIQPELTKLKEKYPDDAQKVNAEMMKLYSKYGINPVSGCLPMLIQIPIFFAFYRVLQHAAELRGQSFFGWIHDLSLPDTVCQIPLPFSGSWDSIAFNILPIIMAVTMVLQMRLTPQAGDKTQRMIMNFMPVMFFFFCYSFASALALYWTTQNIISIGQTLLIRRLPMPELKEVKRKKGGGFFEKIAAQQRALEEQKRQAGHSKKKH